MANDHGHLDGDGLTQVLQSVNQRIDEEIDGLRETIEEVEGGSPLSAEAINTVLTATGFPAIT